MMYATGAFSDNQAARAERLVVVELTETLAGSVCGRLFAGLGHTVTLVEPPAGHVLRSRSTTFAAVAAGKRSVVCDPATSPARWADLLSRCDVLITDLPAGRARALGLDADALAARHPHLIAVSLTAFGLDGALADVPGDSLLAEAHGGLAHMIGEPDRSPLSLGGEQAAHAAAFVGLLGASLALLRRAYTGTGDHVEVAMSDVVAYMDWKSDVVYQCSRVVPARAGASAGAWRVVAALDGWIGVIFLPHQWDAVVELVGDPLLADADLRDAATRLSRAEEVWPRIAAAIGRRPAREVYDAAQALGLPFGYAASAADLLEDPQLQFRNFLTTGERRRDTPVLTFPVPGTETAGAPAAPTLGSGSFDQPRSPATHSSPVGVSTTDRPVAPLSGLLVVDFGTITAGPAVGRLLADYGATVVKIESSDRPDRFRQWVLPGSGSGPTPTTSPMFDSNNAGKLGLSVDLKSPGGKRVIHDLLSRADIVVENYRAGVTSRLGIDPDTVQAINPRVIYLSLSSQGGTGPQSQTTSYGCTLDLLSGLAAATGYRDGPPLWSSGDVNYPDQVVSLAGAALVAHAAATGDLGARFDLSQREMIAWTLADQLADYIYDDRPLQSQGCRRARSTPHDVYPTRDGGWLAVACQDDAHRRALAQVVPGLPGDDASAWWADQDGVDETIRTWTRLRDRDEAVDLLLGAEVPAVAVATAADRAERTEYGDRRLALSRPDGGFLKGFPLRLRGFSPNDPGASPRLGDDVPDVGTVAHQEFLRALNGALQPHGDGLRLLG